MKNTTRTRKTKTKEQTTRNFVAKYARAVNKSGFHESSKYERRVKHKKEYTD